jgi:hypothetical protein
VSAGDFHGNHGSAFVVGGMICLLGAQRTETRMEIERTGTDARFKARVDLWMHCNNLMWSRLQPLSFVQVAYFAVSAYIIQGNLAFYLAMIALMVAAIFTILLLGLSVNERNDRNIQGEILIKEFGFDPTEYSEDGRERKYKLQGQDHARFWIFRLGLLVCIYALWIIIDVAVCLYVVLKVG